MMVFACRPVADLLQLFPFFWNIPMPWISRLDIAPRAMTMAVDATQVGLGTGMKRGLGIATVFVTVMLLLCQSAEARVLKRNQDDPRLFWSGLAVGAGMTAGYFALRDWRWKDPRNPKVSSGGAVVLTTVGCMALAPIVGTVVVQRELTMREAYVMTADCVVPFVGGWLMGQAFDAHPEWDRRARRSR